MSCQCDLCKRNAEFTRHLSFVPEEQQKYFNDLYEYLLNTELDLEVWNAVQDGSWPCSKELVERIAQKLGYKLVPIDNV